jgi:hypothetical protein
VIDMEQKSGRLEVRRAQGTRPFPVRSNIRIRGRSFMPMTAATPMPGAGRTGRAGAPPFVPQLQWR